MMSDVNAEGYVPPSGDDAGAGGDHLQAPDPFIAEAREQGWVPLEEYRGDPSDWRDAETFARRGREINPILRKQLAKKDAEISRLHAEMTEQGATVKEIRTYLKKVEDNAMKNALAQLKQQKRDALAQGDFVAAEDIGDQMEDLKNSPSSIPEERKTATVPEGQIHPDVKVWMENNPWFSDKNPELVEYANGAALSLQNANQQKPESQRLSPKEILDAVSVKVKKVFPKHFDGEAPPAMFESGSGTGGSSFVAPKGKGFSSLPKEAQQQFDRFFKQGFFVDIATGKKLEKAAAQAEYFNNY
jgi:hypothetical protein